MIIPAKIIHNCIAQLLAHPSNEKSLECICVLLTNVGKYLELSSFTQTSTSSVYIVFYFFIRILNVLIDERSIHIIEEWKYNGFILQQSQKRRDEEPPGIPKDSFDDHGCY